MNSLCSSPGFSRSLPEHSSTKHKGQPPLPPSPPPPPSQTVSACHLQQRSCFFLFLPVSLSNTTAAAAADPGCSICHPQGKNTRRACLLSLAPASRARPADCPLYAAENESKQDAPVLLFSSRQMVSSDVSGWLLHTSKWQKKNATRLKL